MAIKRSPTDFLVEEVLDAELAATLSDSPRSYALYRLTKTGLTTQEALGAIARALQLPPGAVEPAGLKDKHARTVQHISLKLTRPMPGGGPDKLGRGSWHIVRLGWMDRPITSAAIAANRFTLVLRGLSGRACQEMDECVSLLADPRQGKTLLFVNYFGSQRFGSARHGKGFLARQLIRGQFEEALKLAIATPARKDRMADKQFKRKLAVGWGQWLELARSLPRRPERAAVELLARGGDFLSAFAALPYFFQQLCVEAYQSHLWNEIARRLINDTCRERGAVLVADDPFGPMVFPAAADLPPELLELNLPLLGHNSQLLEPWQSAAQAVLEQAGITTADLKIPGLRRPYFGQAPRPLMVRASQFDLSAVWPEGQDVEALGMQDIEPAAQEEDVESAAQEDGAVATAEQAAQEVAAAEQPQVELDEADETPLPPQKAKPGKGRFTRRIRFELPRGAYATVLLRALGQ